MTPSRPDKPSPVLRLVNSAPVAGVAVPQHAVERAYGVPARGLAAQVAPAVAPAPRPSGRTGWADVTQENLSAANFASGVGNTDPRWLLAVKTSSLIEGGKAGLLTPARRREVLNLAGQLRLRSFDANLVIAIVQDAARAGEGALSAGVRSRLTLVGGVEALRAEGDEAVSLRRRLPGLLLGALVLASVLAYGLITWVTAG